MKKIIFLCLGMLLIPSVMGVSYSFDQSLKQQIADGLTFNEILCSNNNHVVSQRPNGNIACVYYETAEKLEWTIQDEEIRINLQLNNIPAIKNCTPKGPDSLPRPDTGYGNATHDFDVKTCEWFERN